ncbi:MAG: hypothetical protein WD335_02725 [Candidatus Paceibacterota bacterium]
MTDTERKVAAFTVAIIIFVGSFISILINYPVMPDFIAGSAAFVLAALGFVIIYRVLKPKIIQIVEFDNGSLYALTSKGEILHIEPRSGESPGCRILMDSSTIEID